jgi:hypothetical protein
MKLLLCNILESGKTSCAWTPSMNTVDLVREPRRVLCRPHERPVHHQPLEPKVHGMTAADADDTDAPQTFRRPPSSGSTSPSSRTFSGATRISMISTLTSSS